MDLKETKIIETAETFQEDIIDLTFKLVKQASTLGEEAPILRIMEEELIKLDLEPIRVDMRPEILSKHPGWNRLPNWAPTSISYESRYNLVAIRSADDKGGHSALMNGHLDIVSPDPLNRWSQDPFQPTLQEDWIYGRGSGDMKSGVAAMCCALKAVERAGFGLR